MRVSGARDETNEASTPCCLFVTANEAGAIARCLGMLTLSAHRRKGGCRHLSAVSSSLQVGLPRAMVVLTAYNFNAVARCLLISARLCKGGASTLVLSPFRASRFAMGMLTLSAHRRKGGCRHLVLSLLPCKWVCRGRRFPLVFAVANSVAGTPCCLLVTARGHALDILIYCVAI